MHLSKLHPQDLTCRRLQFARAHGLAGLGTTDLHCTRWRRRCPKIVIKTNDTVNFSDRQRKRSRNVLVRFGGDIPNLCLDIVQTREQTARRLAVVLSNFVNEIFQSLLLDPGQKPATSNPPLFYLCRSVFQSNLLLVFFAMVSSSKHRDYNDFLVVMHLNMRGRTRRYFNDLRIEITLR